MNGTVILTDGEEPGDKAEHPACHAHVVDGVVVADTRSFYEVLGICRTEDFRDILRAAKKARLAGDVTARQNEAFNTLLDHGARIKYNAVLDANAPKCSACHGCGRVFYRPDDSFAKKDTSYGAVRDPNADVASLHSCICTQCRGNGRV